MTTGSVRLRGGKVREHFVTAGSNGRAQRAPGVGGNPLPGARLVDTGPPPLRKGGYLLLLDGEGGEEVVLGLALLLGRLPQLGQLGLALLDLGLLLVELLDVALVGVGGGR